MTNTKYTRHPYYKYFRNMVSRGRIFRRRCDFKRGLQDFNRWLEAIGPIPEEIEHPAVECYDLAKGYVFDRENNRWNFRWQELSTVRFNARSAVTNLDRSKGGKATAALKKTPFQTGLALRARQAKQKERRETQ